MTPGPVSDSYDPEFGTGANAHDVAAAIRIVRGRLSRLLGKKLKNIVEIAQGPAGPRHELILSERDLRVIRFCLDRATESV